MRCIWHKQMVSSYYFYTKHYELSNFGEVFLRTASGTIQWVMTVETTGKLSLVRHAKVAEFRVLTGLSDVTEKPTARVG